MLTSDSDLASGQELLHLHHFICSTWCSFESLSRGNAVDEIKNGTSKPNMSQQGPGVKEEKSPEHKEKSPEHKEKLPTGSYENYQLQFPY